MFSRRDHLLPGSAFFAFPADDAANVAVFRSTDQGRSWVRSDTGLPGTVRVNAFASSPTRHFAGTDRGVFASHDLGQTWRSVGPSLSPDRSVRILCLTLEGRILYAGTYSDGILVSEDDGDSWTELPGIRRLPAVRCLTRSDGNLWAGLDSGGVLRSKDQGKSWSTLREGLPDNAQVFDLAVVESKVFAGLYAKGLYRLDPKNDRWQHVGEVRPLVLETAGRELIAGHNPGGVYRSSDLGQTWQRAEEVVPPDGPVWASGGNGNLILAGIGDGIIRSDDHGQTWAKTEAGLPAISSGIAFLVTEPVILAAISMGAGSSTQ